MKFEHTKVFNWEGAIMGMRNPWESWDKSDSIFHYVVAKDTNGRKYIVFKNGKVAFVKSDEL